MNTLLNRYYTKSIRLAPDGFSLFCLDEGGNLRQERYPAIENALISSKAPAFFPLDENKQSVDIVVATRIPLLVPEILYEDSKCLEFLKMQYDISQFGQSFSEPIGQYRSIYFLTQNENDTIRELPCTPHIVSEASLLYRFLIDQEKKDSVLLSINDTFADIIALQNESPLLVNRTLHVENVDLLYYTLNSVQQLGLTRPTLYVHYFSKSNRKLNNLLAQYIDNIILL